MTLTVDATFRRDSLKVRRRRIGAQRMISEDADYQQETCLKVVNVRPCYNREGCEVLLEDPAIGLWADEAASDFGVTPADALELLAYALFLDGCK